MSSATPPPVIFPTDPPPSPIVHLVAELLSTIKPGWKTSEAQLAAAVMAFGGVIEVLSLFTDALHSFGVDATWLHLAGSVIGGLLVVLPYLGYNRGRAIQKQTAVAVAQVAQALSAPSSTRVSVSVPQGVGAPSAHPSTPL